MENKEKNIDDLFREGLGGYAETPPPAAWDRLEKKLEVNKTANAGRSYRGYGYFAIVVLLLLLGVSIVRNIAGSSFYSPKNVASNENSVTNAPGGTNPDSTTKNANIPITQTKEIATGNNNAVDKVENEKNDQVRKNAEPGKTDRSTRTIVGNNKTDQNKRILPAGKKNHLNNYTSSETSKEKNNSKGKNGTETGENANDREIVYNSSTLNTTAKKVTGPHADEQDATGKSKEVAIAPAKPIPTKPKANLADENGTKQKARAKFNRFEAGVKAGYETGFNNDAAKKAIVSPYLQFNFTPKFSIMLQPSIKSAFLSSRRIGTPQSYYKVNNDGKTTFVDSIPVYSPDGTGLLWVRDYTYSQSHDSIVKISSIGGSYTEFEVPVLIKYSISKKFSVYGGVNVIYSKLINISEKTNITRSIPVTKPKSTISDYNAPAPTPPSIDSVITYSGTPISSYTGPQYPATQSSQVRYGYMLGFSYEYNKRWLFDALVQQASVNANMQAGYNINSALSAAYLRLTLGYKLTK